MQNKKLAILLVSVLSFSFSFSYGQSADAILAYITRYKDLAISEMKRTGVPAAITLAQGIHETEAGTSPLVKKSNNHFGIKCKSTWTAGGVSHDDDAPGESVRRVQLDSPVATPGDFFIFSGSCVWQAFHRYIAHVSALFTALRSI